MIEETTAPETAEINGVQMTLEEFVAACEAHGPTVERFYAQEPVECADLDLSLVAALIDGKFPDAPSVIVLNREDFTMLLTGGIQIGYTLARRTDAGTLVAAEGETDGEAADEEGGE